MYIEYILGNKRGGGAKIDIVCKFEYFLILLRS